MVRVVGLTGGIACGKSTCTARLAKNQGIEVIDCDLLARKVVQPGERGLVRCRCSCSTAGPRLSPLRAEPPTRVVSGMQANIIRSFGPGVLRQDGTLDRAFLGELVFKDPEKRRELSQVGWRCLCSAWLSPQHPLLLYKVYRHAHRPGDWQGAALALLQVHASGHSRRPNVGCKFVTRLRLVY